MCDWVMIVRHIKNVIKHDNDCVDTNRTRVSLGHEYKTHTSRAKKRLGTDTGTPIRATGP
jgi:hypothetical protein